MKILKNMALLGLLCSGYSVMAMDEDEEFNRAIAESLKESQESSAGQAEREARAEAEFEEQMRAAIAASQQEMVGSQARQNQMPMTSFGQSSSSRQPQVTNSNRPPLSKAEREAAQAEAEFEEQMRAAIAASQQEMVGSQARQNQMPMTNFGESSSSRQPQVTNSNRPALTREAAATKIQKFYKRKKLDDAGIRIFGRDEPLELDLERYPNTNPTEQALTKLLNTHEQDKDYIPGLPSVTVNSIRLGGWLHRGHFAAYKGAGRLGEKPLLFLKISNDSSIPEKLEALQKGPIGRFNSKAMSNKELPIIVLQEVFFIYKDQKGNKCTIEVMHPAPGEVFSKLTAHQDYAEKVGKALGLFHVYFMNYHNSRDPKDWTTMIHGDFHGDNIFYNAQRSRVYFIDNASMCEGENPLKDVRGLLSNGSRLTMYDVLLGCRDCNWKKFFIKGYLSAYPVNKRILMLNYLLPDRNDTIFYGKPLDQGKEEIRRNLNTFFEQACQR